MKILYLQVNGSWTSAVGWGCIQEPTGSNMKGVLRRIRMTGLVPWYGLKPLDFLNLALATI